MANEKHYLDLTGLTLYDGLIKGYVTGKTDEIHQEVVELSQIVDTKADSATTLSGYGITDAKIENAATGFTITLGSTDLNVYSTDQIDDTHKTIAKAIIENNDDIAYVSAMTISASTDIAALSASTITGLNDRYTKTEADGKFQLLSNLTTAITSSSTHVQYPSAKAVYDAIDASTSGLEPRVQTLEGKVTTIEGLIPSEATTANTLADKNFVNSSIATETATFRGTYRLVEDLGLTWEDRNDEKAIATALKAVMDAATPPITPDKNDYSFVIIPAHDDASGHTEARFDRYKYGEWVESATTYYWAYEYSLNNSSFTAAQWAAIQSGINSTKVANYDTHIADTDIHVTTTDKEKWNAYETGKADTATTISGYGITDAKITDITTASTITLGNVNLDVYSAAQVDEKINAIQTITEAEIRALFS